MRVGVGVGVRVGVTVGVRVGVAVRASGVGVGVRVGVTVGVRVGVAVRVGVGVGVRVGVTVGVRVGVAVRVGVGVGVRVGVGVGVRVGVGVGVRVGVTMAFAIASQWARTIAIIKSKLVIIGFKSFSFCDPQPCRLRGRSQSASGESAMNPCLLRCREAGSCREISEEQRFQARVFEAPEPRTRRRLTNSTDFGQP